MIRSSLSAHFHGRDTATVYFTPSLFERLLLRRSRERVAVMTRLHYGGLRWRWLDGSDVPGDVWCVCTDAYRSAVAQRAGGAA